MVRAWTFAALVAAAVVTVATAAEVPQPAVGVGPAASTPCPCGPATCTVCAPEVEKVTKTHHLYRCKCRTICLTCKPMEKGCCSESACCGDKPCGKPREVRVLIKRFVKEEKCELRCKPQEVPVCVTPCESCPTPKAP